MRTATFLSNVPVLGGLSDGELGRLAGHVREVQLQAGRWLIREGDAADSLYIVRSGRLEVLAEGPPETLVRVLRRGDVVGELALLRRGTRSASVRALRDSELLALGRDEFEALILSSPSFALGLTRTMGAQLAASRSPREAPVAPRTAAVVALDAGVHAAEVAAEIARELDRYGRVATLASGTLASIDQAERDAAHIVLCGTSSPEDRWTELCLREADRVFAVASGVPDRRWLAHPTTLQGCELIIRGPSVSSSLIGALRPRETQVVADAARYREALAAAARRFAGRSLGIVLSGGGARAFAHLGVLEELHAAGVRFDRIGGVSLGALIAAAAASGFAIPDVIARAEDSFVRTNPSNDFVLPAYSILRGTKTRRLIAENFGERRIEELPHRFFCLSCDLVAREPVVHRAGPVADAVYSSLAIPGVFPPVPTADGRLLVDGGVLDNLPVATMARSAEGPVIAVDVTGKIGRIERAQRPRAARLGSSMRVALTGSEARIPRITETLMRTLVVGSVDTVQAARRHADLVITPQVDGIGLMDWKALQHVRALGRRAARETLDSTDLFGLSTSRVRVAGEHRRQISSTRSRNRREYAHVDSR